MVSEEPWGGIAEVAAHLRVARDSVYRWVDTQGLPAHGVGRLFRFRLSEVDEWVKAGGEGTETSSSSKMTDKGRRKNG